MAASLRRSLVVLALFMCYLLGVSSLQIVGIYMTSLSEEFDVSTALLGVLCGFGFSLQLMLGPFASVVVDKFGFRWAVMAGGTLEAVGITLCFFARSTTALIIYLGILPGIGTSLIYVSGPGLMACYFTRNYSTVMGIVLAGVGAGIFMIPPLVEELINMYGWRGAFLIHGALTFNTVTAGAMFNTVAITKQRDKHQNKNDIIYHDIEYHEKVPQINSQNDVSKNHMCDLQQRKSYSKWIPSHILLLMDAPKIVLVYSTAFLVNIAYSAAVIHTSNQVVQSGYTETQGALALSLLGVGSLIGRALHGVPVDAKLIAPSMFYLLSLVIAALVSFLNASINTYVICVLCVTSIGVTSGVQFPLTYAIMRPMAGVSRMHTATGLEMLADGCGFLVGGYLAGAVQDMTGNYNLAHHIFGATYLLGACLFIPLVILERKEDTTLSKNEMVKDNFN